MKKIIIGNWKMNPESHKEALKIYKKISKNISGFRKVDISICPPFIYLFLVKKLSRKIKLGAQDVFWVNKGPVTGEISPRMLNDLGVEYVVLGHSERRSRGETSVEVSKKAKAALRSLVFPVICVGESNRDKEHRYLDFIRTQLEESLEGVSKSVLSKVIIAYEPLWAIGSHAERPATPAEFLEMSIFIKKVISDKFGIKNAKGVRVIYGGSVHPKNAKDFLEEGEADGFLVGRDSLKPEKFLEIIDIAEHSF